MRRNLTFSGLSGDVQFNVDGDRSPDTAHFQLQNLLKDGSGGLYPQPKATYGNDSWQFEGGSIGAAGLIYTGGQSKAPVEPSSSDSHPDKAFVVPVITALVSTLGCLLLVACAFGARRLVARAAAALRSEHHERIDKIDRVTNAAAKCSELLYAMNFIRFSQFRACGKMVAHEEARDAGLLVCIDEFDELPAFLSEHPTVFISHQWLGSTAPDEGHVHFAAICRAVDALCAKHAALNPDDIYLWIDYSSVPQRAKAVQRLAIGTLSVYASVCLFFLVIAPDTRSKQGHACTAMTYAARGWCRLEMWARLTGAGGARMFLFAANTLQTINPAGEWFGRDAIFVLEGNFSVASDRHALVDTILSLWAVMLVTSEEASDREEALIALIRENHARVFPYQFFGSLVSYLERLHGMAVEAEGALRASQMLGGAPLSPLKDGREAQVRRSARAWDSALRITKQSSRWTQANELDEKAGVMLAPLGGAKKQPGSGDAGNDGNAAKGVMINAQDVQGAGSVHSSARGHLFAGFLASSRKALRVDSQLSGYLEIGYAELLATKMRASAEQLRAPVERLAALRARVGAAWDQRIGPPDRATSTPGSTASTPGRATLPAPSSAHVPTEAPPGSRLFRLSNASLESSFQASSEASCGSVSRATAGDERASADFNAVVTVIEDEESRGSGGVAAHLMRKQGSGKSPR